MPKFKKKYRWRDRQKHLDALNHKREQMKRLRKYAFDSDMYKFWVLRQLQPTSILRVITEKFGHYQATSLSACFEQVGGTTNPLLSRICYALARHYN